MARLSSVVLLAALLSPAGLGAAGPKTTDLKVPRRPEARLALAEQLAKEGRHADAAAVVDRLAFDASNAGASRSFLARAYALRALAAAGEGRLEDAGFDWSVALFFDRSVADLGPAFGDASRRLKEAVAALRELAGRAVPASTPGLKPPELLRDARPALPTPRRCRNSVTLIETWLDERGQVRGIRSGSSSCHDAYLVTFIEAARRRQYRGGADASGQPVALRIELTLNTSTLADSPVNGWSRPVD
jgi:hypothetical protein